MKKGSGGKKYNLSIIHTCINDMVRNETRAVRTRLKNYERVPISRGSR